MGVKYRTKIMSCSEGVGVLMAFQKGVIYTKQLLQNLILSRNSQDSQKEIFELINANFSLRDKYAEAQQQGAHHAAPGLHGRFTFVLSLKLSFSFSHCLITSMIILADHPQEGLLPLPADEQQPVSAENAWK